MTFTVALVRVGEKYGREYVSIVRDALQRHLPLPHRIRCITDDPEPIEGVESLPADPGLPGWWQKVRLFDRALFPHKTLYLDLDVVLQGNIRGLVKAGQWIMDDPWADTYNSSVMCWAPDYDTARIWRTFDPEVMYAMPGDQDWISRFAGWNTYPEALVQSWKEEHRQGRKPTAPVVVFHGHPKPHELPDEPLIQQHWRHT